MAFGTYAAEITLDKYDVRDASTICAIEPTLKAVYLTSFGHVYKDHWTEPFAQSFIHYFDNYFEKLKQGDNMLLVVAKKNDRVAGWILFLCREQLAIIDIICVDPAFQQQGVGKALVFSIKNYLPEIKSVAVVTMRINTVSPFFYERLGFVKTNFLYEDFKADEMQGYELAIDANPLKKSTV
jgi:ribosomal protein S18 acetylase RimI-like enzyme